MKKVSKIICAVLAVLLLVPFGIFAAAEETDPGTGPVPTVTVGTASGRLGDTVQITVSLENNPGFTAFVVGVEYDHTQLTLLKDSAVSAPGVPSTPSCSEVGFAWLASRDFYGNGPFVILKFLINRDAEEGSTVPVRLVCKPGNICNYNEKEVNFTFVDGSVEIIPHEHVYESAVTDPTCEEQGYTTHTCTICGDSYSNGFTDALGHDFGNWTVTAEPTCTADGVETRYCSRCDAVETRPVGASGHDYAAAETVAPSCTESGYTLYTCSRCGDSYTDDPVPASGHDYAATETVAPTCTESGYTVYTCSRCGASYTDDSAPASGHVWGDGEVTRRPTETEAGVRLFTCAACGETKEEEIPTLDYLRGDINGDGAVDTKDLVRYQNYLADGSTPVVEKALDVNGDGGQGVDDLVRLLKYLAGYDVELF